MRYVDHSLTGGGDDLVGAAGASRRACPGWGDGLMFRGVYTEAIRSPAVTELFTEHAGHESFADPCDADALDSGPNPAARAANCARRSLPSVSPTRPAFDTENTTGLASRRRQPGRQSATWRTRRRNPGRWVSCFSRSRFRGCAWRSTGPTSGSTGGISRRWRSIELTSSATTAHLSECACATVSARYTAADIAACRRRSRHRQVGDLANGFQARYINMARMRVRRA